MVLWRLSHLISSIGCLAGLLTFNCTDIFLQLLNLHLPFLFVAVLLLLSKFREIDVLELPIIIVFVMELLQKLVECFGL